MLKGARSVEVEKNNAIDINDKNATIKNNKNIIFLFYSNFSLRI